MALASALSPEKRFMALFVSPSGSGKTVAACSFRDSSDQLIYDFDFDGRIGGLLGATWIDRKNIEYDYFPPRKAGLVDLVEKKLEVLQTYAVSGQYQNLPTTIILDSLTSQTLAMIFQALPLTHNKGKNEKQTGRYIGDFAMTGPDDFNFEAQTTYSIMSFFRSLPVKNIIVTAHVVPTYGKEDPENPFSQTIITGEALSIRPKIAANIGIYFDHVFRFDRREGAFGKDKYTVKFRGGIARTSFADLPDGEIDITDKNFYKEVFLPALQKKQEVKNG